MAPRLYSPRFGIVRPEQLFSATPQANPAFLLREAVMWRIAFLSLAILGIALGACAQEVQIAKPVTGDYEVVALMAD
jgi:hypothetical protein